MRALLTAAALLALAGCDTLNAVMHPVSPNEIAAIELALTTAENLARNYTQLPACTGATSVCSDPATKQKIKDDDNKAYAAVMALRQASTLGTPTALSAAQTAIAAFNADIPGHN